MEKGPFNIGQVLSLVRTEFSQEAYRDQFKIPHQGSVVQEVVEVRITETSIPHGNYSPSNLYVGYRATCGERVFECQWKVFDEASNNAYCNWIETTYKRIGDCLFHEACLLLGGGNYFPIVDKDGKRPEIPYVGVCDKHNFPSFHRVGENCWKCQYKLP